MAPRCLLPRMVDYVPTFEEANCLVPLAERKTLVFA